MIIVQSSSVYVIDYVAIKKDIDINKKHAKMGQNISN